MENPTVAIVFCANLRPHAGFDSLENDQNSRKNWPLKIAHLGNIAQLGYSEIAQMGNRKKLPKWANSYRLLKVQKRKKT